MGDRNYLDNIEERLRSAERMIEKLPLSLAENNNMLARIDERTMALAIEVQSLKKIITESYVRREEFEPIKNAVYGVISLILLSVVGTMVAFFIKR